MAGKIMDNARAPMSERQLDSYPTPPEAVLALMGVEALPLALWEPAVGAGNIASTLVESGRLVLASDIVDRGYRMTLVSDFLGDVLSWDAFAIDGVKPQAIITNPPFSKAAAFVERALFYVPDVYMLLRLNFLEGGQRDPVRDRILNPGGGLRKVYPFRERLPMMHREGWSGPEASSKVTHAWFCWRRGFKGKAQMQRLSWKNPKPPLPPPAPKLPKGRDPNTKDMFEEATP
jgi:hypothetical protein